MHATQTTPTPGTTSTEGRISAGARFHRLWRGSSHSPDLRNRRYARPHEVERTRRRKTSKQPLDNRREPKRRSSARWPRLLRPERAR
jgi:hypothetical protein